MNSRACFWPRSLLCCGVAAALDADLVSSDVTVVLRPDGKADVTYRLEWTASGGRGMSGFYFEGEAAPLAWNPEYCWADLPDGTRSALDIKRVSGGKWDVILANGRRFTGRAFYNISYGADSPMPDSWATQRRTTGRSSSTSPGLPWSGNTRWTRRRYASSFPIRWLQKRLPLSP
jgi:hypothetical protein